MSQRRVAELGPLRLELGGALPQVSAAYETWGVPSRDRNGRITNAVLVLHALTGDAHIAGPSGPGQPSPGWWDGLVGPGRALDPDEWFIVAANVLGGCQGTTGPASRAPDGRTWGSRFPRITIRDQVQVEALLADRLGIDRYRAVLGGSMGGMRALEWVVAYPGRVGAALVVAVGAAATADQIGVQSAQLAAIRLDPYWLAGDYPRPLIGSAGQTAAAEPVRGLGLARQIAQLSYRSETEFAARFGNAAQGGEEPMRGGRFAVQSYLEHQGNKLVGRFDAGSYVTLTEAMNTHDVGRGRGGVPAVLAGVRVPLVVAGIDTDRLYPLRLQAEIADLVPTCSHLDVIESPYGHDGFLLEVDQVAALTQRVLAASAPAFTRA